MIDTAGTLKAAAQTVLDEGAARVYAAATHPVFSGNAYENLAAAELRADRRHRHDPAARRARPTTSACCRARTCSPTRSAGSSRTTRCPRSSAARTSSSERASRSRGARGRMTSTAAALLMDRLGLTEDELCAVLGVDPLTVLAGDLDHKPQLPILLALHRRGGGAGGRGRAAPLGARHRPRRPTARPSARERLRRVRGRPRDARRARVRAARRALERRRGRARRRGRWRRGRSARRPGRRERCERGRRGRGERLGRERRRGAQRPGRGERCERGRRGSASGSAESDGEPRGAEADGDEPNPGADAGAP